MADLLGRPAMQTGQKKAHVPGVRQRRARISVPEGPRRGRMPAEPEAPPFRGRRPEGLGRGRSMATRKSKSRKSTSRARAGKPAKRAKPGKAGRRAAKAAPRAAKPKAAA